ncbi:hypothetical protein [Nostoc sp.]|uniref:hypothetical protein n=1 Tax=Nostoc sp. TaxID=1180 RepID=UPI002FF528CC
MKRSANKYWYYRYCWMIGRKIHRIYLGSVDSIKAKKLKQAVEIAIANDRLPIELKHLIRGWKNEKTSPTIPKMPGSNTNF